MKNVCLLGLLTLSLYACHKKTNAQNSSYKGTPKYGAINAAVLPTAGEYDTSRVMPDSISKKMQAFLDTVTNVKNVAGISVAVISPKGCWSSQQGYIAKPFNQVVDDNTIFYWASVAKLITGVIIQDLCKENKLHLTDVLSTWFPQFQNADHITVKQMLNHTSGLYSFNSDPLLQQAGTWVDPDALLAIASSHNNLYFPGQYWAYTNTGFLLLALIAEMVEGKPYARIIADRIAKPYHLSTLRALDPRDQPGNLALAHKEGIIVPTAFSLPLGAGNVVSNAKDMSLLLYNLLTGKILPQPVVLSMLKDLYPMFDTKFEFYGDAIMLYDFSRDSRPYGIWVGHAGGTEDYKSILVYQVQTKSFVAVSINQNAPAEGVAFRLQNILH